MRRNGNGQVRLWQKACAFIWPLDQAQRVILEIIPNTHVLQLFGVYQAIEVKVEGSYRTDLIRFDQRKGRTFHRSRMAQPTNDPPGQRGLARPQVAFEKDQPRSARHLGNPMTERNHYLFIRQEKDYFRHGDCSSSNGRMAGIRSLAARPRPKVPCRAPAVACNHTARQPASYAGIPCASNAPTRPANTSPSPAVAMAGWPWSQRATRPSGLAIKLPAPLRIATALNFWLNARATLRRSA